METRLAQYQAGFAMSRKLRKKLRISFHCFITVTLKTFHIKIIFMLSNAFPQHFFVGKSKEFLVKKPQNPFLQ
jgi:hypothetical protein